MIRRHTLLSAATLALAFATGTASAAERPYTAAAFHAAEAQGKPILVEIHASWCPTCKAQKPILGRLETRPKFKDLAVFRVDFDGQKKAVRAFGARMQSTLIVFHGAKETGRSVGDTKAASIAALLDKAL